MTARVADIRLRRGVGGFAGPGSIGVQQLNFRRAATGVYGPSDALGNYATRRVGARRAFTRQLAEFSEERQEELSAEVYAGFLQFLKSRARKGGGPKGRWPILTGLSRRQFRAVPVLGGDGVQLVSTTYARYVNGRYGNIVLKEWGKFDPRSVLERSPFG